MHANINGRSKILGVLILALVALILYVISIYYAFPVFQQTRISDAQAEYHSLSPLFFIAVGLVACLGCYCLIAKIRNKPLLLGILVLLAVMLWLTPYVLSSYVRFSDSTWHVGIAMKMPQVLAGDQVALSNYGRGYSAGYIFHYGAVSLLGIEPMAYIQVFPLVCLVFFMAFCFLLVSRLFNYRVAFLALLIAIPCLHYIQIHASPHALGAVLMLCACLLLTIPGVLSRILGCLVIIDVVFTHPTTPLLIMIFLGAAILMLIITERKLRRFQLVLAVILIATFAGWFFVHSNSIRSAEQNKTPSIQSEQISATQTVQRTTSEIVSNVLPEDLSTGQKFIQGTQYIYKNIYNLNKGIYFLLAAVALLGILLAMTISLIRKKNFKKWITGLGSFKPGEILMILTIPLLLILSLLLAEGAHDLLETGLTYIILALACIVSSLILRLNWIKRLAPALVLTAGVLFLTLTFPIVIYGIDAYSSPPLSEEYGLKYVANLTPIDGKSVGGDFLSQLAFYLPSTVKKVTLCSQNFNDAQPDITVFRNTAFYYQSMRFAFSFENNGYTRSLTMVENLMYTKVYSSSTVKVFLKNQICPE
jgi:hypothetical protein